MNTYRIYHYILSYYSKVCKPEYTDVYHYILSYDSKVCFFNSEFSVASAGYHFRCFYQYTSILYFEFFEQIFQLCLNFMYHCFQRFLQRKIEIKFYVVKNANS
jgi:hypothetical protein